VKILACALKNKIKNKNFLKLLEGLLASWLLSRIPITPIDPLIMSHEPMATAQK